MKPIAALVLVLASFAMQASPAKEMDPPDSVYQLEARLTDQAGRARGFDLYRGSPVLVTMFYGSCPATCPLIIDTLRAIERELPVENRGRLRVLMISIDTARDTPDALRELAATRRIDVTRWTLASTDESSVREIAALLNVQYRRLPNGDFNHSTVITLLSRDGRIAARSSELGHADPVLVDRLRD